MSPDVPTDGADRDQLEAGTCKGCGAAIRWGVTVHGRKIPLNDEPAMGYVLSRDMPLLMVRRDVFTPHHATCPMAADFRRPAEGPTTEAAPPKEAAA